MSVRSILVVAAIMLLIASATACERVPIDGDAGAEPSATPEVDPSPAAITPTPFPTRPEPTPLPSGSMLRIRAVPARAVILGDPELPAEYVRTRFTLFRRSESLEWSYAGPLPVRGTIIADPTEPERLYIGDHPPCTSDEQPIPFFRSNDGGEHWQRIQDADNIRPIMVLPERPEVLIGSRCGLVISLDRGKTWQSHLPDSGFELTRLTSTPIGLFGVFTSEDQTSYLRRIDIEDPASPVFEEPLLSFWGPGAVHATQERILVGDSSGVHFSDDGGRTWSFTREGLEDLVASVDPLEEDIPEAELQRGIGIRAIAPHPTDQSRVFVGTTSGLYLSEDGGESWGRIPEVEEYDVRELSFAMDGAVLYATTTVGVIVLHNP